MEKKDVFLTIGGLGALYLLNRLGGNVSTGSMSSALLGTIPQIGNPIVDLASRQAADLVAQALSAEPPQAATRIRRTQRVVLDGKEVVIRDAEWSPVPPTDHTGT